MREALDEARSALDLARAPSRIVRKGVEIRDVERERVAVVNVRRVVPPIGEPRGGLAICSERVAVRLEPRLQPLTEATRRAERLDARFGLCERCIRRERLRRLKVNRQRLG